LHAPRHTVFYITSGPPVFLSELEAKYASESEHSIAYDACRSELPS